MSRHEIEHDLPWSWTPPRVRQVLAQSDTNAYVATVNGQRSGFSITTLGARQAHLVLLAVLPDWRRLGLGSQLLSWQLETARTAGIVRMSLEVRSRNRAARIFYQQQGFRFERSIPGYYSRREDAVRMSLSPLCPVLDP